MNTENQSLKLIGIFLTGAIVGALSVWMWTATQDILSSEEVIQVEDSTSASEEDAVQDQASTVQELVTDETQLRSDSIIVRNQRAGLLVEIEKVIFEEGGWLVIHEGTTSQVGNALGAARFDKGEHSGIVELLRATEVGMLYRAILYQDNGDKEFNLDSDFPLLQNGNQPVLTTFIVE